MASCVDSVMSLQQAEKDTKDGFRGIQIVATAGNIIEDDYDSVAPSSAAGETSPDAQSDSRDAADTPDAAHQGNGPSSIEAWLQAEPKWQRRTALPPPAQPTPRGLNVWAIIKDVVGKGDLSRVATPVQFLEPLSELQQRCEDLEFTELLDQAAAAEPRGLERLLLVAAFSVSAYSGVVRTCKPFNALLGETYELACPKKGFRFLAEKVQDARTTINHVRAEGRRWAFDLEDELHTRFTGTAIELAPLVLLQVVFDDGDTYRWHKAVTSIHGVVTGRISLEHKGAYTVRCCATGLTAAMKLHASTMLTPKARMHEVSGNVLDAEGQPLKGLKLAGKWDRELITHMPDGSSRLLWRVNPPAADPSRYNMTPWVLALNEAALDLARLLPTTDTRLRADIRALELGQYDKAQEQHAQITERHAAQLKQNGAAHRPAWFERVPGSTKMGQEFLFRYKGGYWEARAAGTFAKPAAE